MKRLCCYLGIIALMSLSCNKWGKTDDIQIEVPEGKYLFSVQASQTTDTKTTYTGDKTFHWGIKDKISVLFHNTIEPYDNKFYTLSYISEADGTATFRGTIDDGYAIGAADGEHLKWALYPASDNHSYSAGTDPITFHIPALTDYTASGAEFSANLPMRAIGDGSNHFTFTHMAGTYKFVFTDIDESVSKVRLTVENQGSRALSGNIPTTGGSLYLAHDSSSGSRSIAFVENVSGSHSATFYVPYRGWHSDFQPVLTLSNEDNSYVLLEKTAKAAYNDDGKLTASVSHIIITQDFSAPGTGTPPFSQLIVTDGNMSDWDPAVNKKLSESNLATTTGNEKIKELKVAYDELYFYIYIKRNHTSELWGTSSYFYVFMDNDNDSLNGVEKNGYKYEYGFVIYPFAGTAATKETAAVPGFYSEPSVEKATGEFTYGSGLTALCGGTYDATDVETEFRILRSSLRIDKDDVISIAVYGNKSADSTPYTRITGFTINN